jgi:hypothetical protein
VSENTALTVLLCYDNNLTDIDVRRNAALIELLCGGNQSFCSVNQLTHLDVSQNIALKMLCCSFNKLTHLDVSKNTALEFLFCNDNQLTHLDVSKNTALTGLSCNNNQLTHLDVSKNTALIYLYCCENKFSGIALNSLFETLHNNNEYNKYIYIRQNPGTDDCNTEIAQNRDWIVVFSEVPL